MKKTIIGFILSISTLVLGFVGTSYSWFYSSFNNGNNTVQSSGFEIELEKGTSIENNLLAGTIVNNENDEEAFSRFFSLSLDNQLTSVNQGVSYIRIQNQGNVDLDFKINGYLISGSNSSHLDDVTVTLVPITDVGETKVRSIQSLYDTNLIHSQDEGQTFQKNSSMIYQIYFNYIGTANTIGANESFEFGLHFSFWYKDNIFSEPFIVKDFAMLTEGVNQTTYKHIHVLNDITEEENLTISQLLNINLNGNLLTVDEFTIESQQYGTATFENGLIEATIFEVFIPNGLFRHLWNFELISYDSYLTTSKDGYLLDGHLVQKNNVYAGGNTILNVYSNGNLVIYNDLILNQDAKLNKVNHSYVRNSIFIYHNDLFNSLLGVGSAKQMNLFTNNFNQIQDVFLDSSFEIKLLNDLDFEGRLFEQIGSDSNPWKAIFNGNGFTISDYYLDFSTQNIGMFFLNDGLIKNLILEPLDIEVALVSTDSLKFGLLVATNRGELSNLSLSNINIKLSFSGTSSFVNIGGLIGKDVFNPERNDSVIFTKLESLSSYANINIHSTSNNFYRIGGILGEASQNRTYNYLDLHNYGEVVYTGMGLPTLGGIGGYIRSINGQHLHNHGMIKATSTNESVTVGGIFGQVEVNGTTQLTNILDRVSNIGEITGISYVYTNYSFGFTGGIIGKLSGWVTRISNALNYSDVSSRFTATIRRLYNMPSSGGLIGYMSPGRIEISTSIVASSILSGNGSSNNEQAYSGGFIGFASSGTLLRIYMTKNIFLGELKTNSEKHYSGPFLSRSTNFHEDHIKLNTFNYYATSVRIYEDGSLDNDYSNKMGIKIDNNQLNQTFLIGLGFDGDVWNLSNINLSNNLLPTLK